MLNIGTGELFVILLIALLIFGPNKLPEMARTFGRAVRAFQEEGRKAAATLKAAVEDQPSKAGVVDRPDPGPSGNGAPVSPPTVDGAADPPGDGSLAEPSPTGTGRVEGPPAPPEPPMDPEQRLLEDT